MKRAGFAGVIVAAAVAVGCSSVSVPNPKPTATAVACPALALVGPQVLYPIPGATGVSTAAGSIVVSGGLPSTAVVDLAAAGGRATDLGPLGPPPSPLPSPEATPYYNPSPPPPPPLYGVAYLQLASGTTYTISYHDTATPCPLAIGGGGTFTTQ
jgi:hypothetical protein